MYYEEFHDGTWRRLGIGGEPLGRRPHLLILFGPRAAWAAQQPEWARERREEIVARIKSACPIPAYRYEGEGVLDAHDRALLIKEADGLSDAECRWAGCTERALKGTALCVTHLYGPEMWSDLDRPTSASSSPAQGVG